MALITALLMTSMLGVLAGGLSLVLSAAPAAAANQRAAVATAYVARAGMEVALQELAAAPAWDPMLSGAATSPLVDGPSSGSRRLPDGGSIDIGVLTNVLTCGAPTACSDASAAAVTRDRPWGANNPRWRPFLYGPSAAIGLDDLPQYYLVAWVGDDGSEVDGRPETDAVDGAGAGVVRIVVQAFGPRHSHAAIEAVAGRRCDRIGEETVCVPGMRVHAWRARTGAFLDPAPAEP